MRAAAVLVLLVGSLVTSGLPVTDEDGDPQELDAVQGNISALWREVNDLRQEVNYHLHHGHDEPNHDQFQEETDILQHEHRVHHIHHPHEGHNDHHRHDLFQHLNTYHGHDQHTITRDQHQHSHEDDDDQDHHDEHSQEDDDDDDDHSQEEHDHGEHETDHVPDDHDHHGLHDDYDEYKHRYRGYRRGHRYGPGHGPSKWSHSRDREDHENSWRHAVCHLQPNADMPESSVRGTITMSQKKDGMGPVYFDLDLTGFDVSQGRVHGFHVHEKSVSEGRCATAGAHFNPHGVTHGGPTSATRHVGDLGNIEVDEDGELEGYIISDTHAAFSGNNSIIGKAIVVHVGVDDLGLGGDAGSLSTGNAGGRLACCNISVVRRFFFRFKG